MKIIRSEFLGNKSQSVKRLGLSIGVLTLSFSLASCGKKEAEPQTMENLDSVTSMAQPEMQNKFEVGVTDCDNFLTKYRACYDSLPPKIQASMKEGLEATEIAWKKAARSGEDQEALIASCQKMEESLAPSMKAQGCSW